MTHQELLRLYGLKGMIEGQMDYQKCELRANHNVRPAFPAKEHQCWLDGRNAVAVRSLGDLNRLRRKICQIIKEAKNARD